MPQIFFVLFHHSVLHEIVISELIDINPPPARILFRSGSFFPVWLVEKIGRNGGKFFLFVFLIKCFEYIEILNVRYFFLHQAAHKSFRIKQKLAKKLKQNRSVPQWVRLRTGNTIR